MRSDTHARLHLPPGSCHRCWAPCHRTVADGEERCRECLTELALTPHTAVRKMLALDPSTPLDVLRLLSSDLDSFVASAARARLPESGDDEHELELEDMESGW